jgi:hypothetical protein
VWTPPLSPVPLATAFLLPREDKTPSRYALNLSDVPDEKVGTLGGAITWSGSCQISHVAMLSVALGDVVHSSI